MIQKVFAKEPRVLKKWNAVSRYWKFNNDKLTVIIEADPVTTTEQSAKELNINHCMVIQHLKQTGKVKKLHKHISELTTIQKYQFWSVIFFPGNNKEPYLKWIVIWDEKWICTTTSSVAGPRSSNVWQSTVCLIATAFWILAKPYLRSMHNKLMRCTNRSLQPATVKREPYFSPQCPIAHHTTSASEEVGYKVLLHLPCSPDLLPTTYHFFKHLNNFLKGKCFHKQKEA